MEHNKSVKLNMFMNAILTMSSFIFPLLTFPYVSRILLPIGTGKVTFANSIVTYFSMFAQLGIPMYGIRACAKVRDDKVQLSRTVHELLIINMITCAASYFVFGIALVSVPRLKQDYLLFCVMSICIALNAIGVEWLYKALEKYTYITVRSVIFKFVSLVAMFLLVQQKEDYIIYGFITVFAASASNVCNFLNLKKYIFIQPIGDYCLKRHLKMVLVFFAMSVATTIYTNLDNVMLGFITTDEQVGYYGAAVKIKNILISVVTSASAVLLPRASYYVDKGLQNEFNHIIKKTMHFVLLAAIPLCSFFMLYAKEGIYFLSGPAFAGSIQPMIIIMPTLILCGMTNVIGIQMMLPLGMEKQVLNSEIAGAVTDLVLNALFIPTLGASGAALGTLIAELVVWFWQMAAIGGGRRSIYTDINMLKIVIAMIGGILSSLWVKHVFSDVFTILLVSAVCYFGSYIVILLALNEHLAREILAQICKIICKRGK